GTKLIPIPRMTLIALVDRYSNFILAYDLVLRKEVSQTDVLACLDKFIYGQTLPVALLEDANLPIGSRGSGPGWGFTTLALDNLTAHLARGVTARVRES